MMDEQDPCAQQRQAQAVQWFARLKTVPVSKATLEDFFEWRRDPANAEAFAQAEAFWAESERLGTRPSIMRLTQETVGRHALTVRSRWFTRSQMAFGTGLLLAMMVAGWWLFATSRSQELATSRGERKALALADGSQLRLNTDTQIEARLDRSTRHIRLDHGQAMFEVAHDRGRPFIVQAGEVAVRATGTRFDVRYLDGATTVTLFEGGVDISAGTKGTVHLKAGESWQSDAMPARSIARVDMRRAAAWTQGRVVFDSTPLHAAIAEMNRYSKNRMILAVPARSDAPISGSFMADDPAGFLKAVSALFSLKVEHEANGSLILRERSLSAN